MGSKRIAGASEIDKCAHRIFGFATDKQSAWRRTGVRCARCGRELETSYCEERLYMVRCRHCGTVTLANAGSPTDAAETIGIKAYPVEDWSEEDGECLWWHFPIEEPAYCGSPITYHSDGSKTVPSWCTHFTRIYCPNEVNDNER